jgi:hypothetical protein
MVTIQRKRATHYDTVSAVLESGPIKVNPVQHIEHPRPHSLHPKSGQPRRGTVYNVELDKRRFTLIGRAAVSSARGGLLCFLGFSSFGPP